MATQIDKKQISREQLTAAIIDQISLNGMLDIIVKGFLVFDPKGVLDKLQTERETGSILGSGTSKIDASEEEILDCLSKIAGQITASNPNFRLSFMPFINPGKATFEVFLYFKAPHQYFKAQVK